MKKILGLCVALLVVAGSVAAQCWGQVPTAPGRVPDRVTISKVSSHEFAVHIDGKQVGNFDADKMTFRPCDAEKWGDPVQLNRIESQQDWRERGVDKSKLRTHTGDAIDIPDDSTKLRVTVIGSKAARQPVADAITEAKLDVALWQCDPDHWSLTDTETGKRVFKSDAPVTMYVQGPDGKVLHRQDDGVDPVGAIRKASKPYQSELDPDLRKPASLPGVPVGSLPILLMVGGVGFALFRHKFGV